MTLILRRSRTQARIEGWTDANWPDDDYAVLDGATIVGRIYQQAIHGEPRWLWFLQCIPEAGPGRPIPRPNQGMAGSLDEAKAAFKARYQQLRERSP